ncbi:MAG: hypothetical protein KJZ93_04670 [Caldilineaceae bacterium]|nr:hypothetical protein [Caldilineaceae bacterium]
MYELRVEAPLGYLAAEPVQFELNSEPNEEFVIVLDAVTHSVYLPMAIAKE